MKQIIIKYPNGKIENKYYKNHLNQYNGLYISYWNNGNIWYKRNFFNDKRFGIANYYYYNNNKPTIITYYL